MDTQTGHSSAREPRTAHCESSAEEAKAVVLEVSALYQMAPSPMSVAKERHSPTQQRAVANSDLVFRTSMACALRVSVTRIDECVLQCFA